MPLVWRWILNQYLKVFLLSVCAFVAVLLTLRLEEIAHFASIDTTGEYLIWFVIYQIPYILPVAIPLSSLIAAMILTRELSHHHELTALRSLGFSFKRIFAPILIAAGFIAAVNFVIMSEVATFSHLKTSLLKTELRSVNPLLLLHNKHLLKMKGIYFDTLGPSKMGEEAFDVIVAIPNKAGERMNLMIAKMLKANIEQFNGNDISLITSLKSKNENEFDSFIIENNQNVSSRIDDFSSIVQRKVWKVSDEHLNFKNLLVKIGEVKKSQLEPKQEKKELSKIYSEIAKRISLGFAPLIFTILGLSFGVEIGRRKSAKGLIYVTALTALYMVTFFLGKGISDHPEATLLLYLCPPLIIVAASIYKLNLTQKGIG